MWSSTNMTGTIKYMASYFSGPILSFSAVNKKGTGTVYEKNLPQEEQKFLDNYEFIIINDAECVCTHELQCEADCTCEHTGFSAYVCTKNSANVIRGFECITS